MVVNKLKKKNSGETGGKGRYVGRDFLEKFYLRYKTTLGENCALDFNISFLTWGQSFYLYIYETINISVLRICEKMLEINTKYWKLVYN